MRTTERMAKCLRTSPCLKTVINHLRKSGAPTPQGVSKQSRCGKMNCIQTHPPRKSGGKPAYNKAQGAPHGFPPVLRGSAHMGFRAVSARRTRFRQRQLSLMASPRDYVRFSQPVIWDWLWAFAIGSLPSSLSSANFSMGIAPVPPRFFCGSWLRLRIGSFG